MHKVTVIQKSLPQYRIEFFNALRQELKQKNIELQLIYGDSHVDNRKDAVTCDWAVYKKNRKIGPGRVHFIWQPCLKEIQSSDLVVVEQANKLLLNYLLICRRLVWGRKFAFWGHGANLQEPKNSPGNLFATLFLKFPNWWFAYTNGVKNYLMDKGVREERIAVVQNAIDTVSLNAEYCSISHEEVTALREELQLEEEEKVLIYCGALTKEKKIDFLLQTAEQLYRQQHRFKLLIIGSGPLQDFVAEEAKRKPWLHFAGPRFGREKAKYFRLADVFLLPGAVGLAILDAFAFETPLVTTRIPNHGPEIEYLVHGQNGLMSEPTLAGYVKEVAGLLNNPEKLQQLKLACRPMINTYNMQQMVSNFTEGIEKALQQ